MELNKNETNFSNLNSSRPLTHKKRPYCQITKEESFSALADWSRNSQPGSKKLLRAGDLSKDKNPVPIFNLKKIDSNSVAASKQRSPMLETNDLNILNQSCLDSTIRPKNIAERTEQTQKTRLDSRQTVHSLDQSLASASKVDLLDKSP